MNIYKLTILFFLSHSYGEHRSMLAVPKVTEPGVGTTTVIPKFAGESHGLVLIFGFYISTNIMHGHTLSNNRYARTGNCNMAAFKRDDGTIDFVTAMLEDVSSYTFMLKSCQSFCQAYTLNLTLSLSHLRKDNYCGPLCPLGGCHA